jgi:catechol 2,3-dioxygenase-like lactoylglutathione lyase family enzyme
MTALADKDAAANLAVKNLAAARKFYEGTLGLKQVGAEGEQLIAYRSGKSTLLVYSRNTPAATRPPRSPGMSARRSKRSRAP